MGEDETTSFNLFIDRHTYLDTKIMKVSIKRKDKDGKVGKYINTKCIVGDKKF
jgi:hypothetical protein